MRILLKRGHENTDREGLKETPNRFANAWHFYTNGYHQNPGDVLKRFKDGASGYDEMVQVGPIPIYSLCEHHLAPFFGACHIAYIPRDYIVGLSKLPRLADIFCRRLQVQERITSQIADALIQHLKPQGVGVVLQCRHMCMEMRGIQKTGTVTTTSALRGAIKDEDSARAEFLAFVREAKQGSLL